MSNTENQTNIEPKTPSPGLGQVDRETFTDPGFPEHRPRRTDVDPVAHDHAQRVVVTWFIVSILGAVLAIWAYFAFPITEDNFRSIHTNNMMVGLGIAIALLGIGIGAVYWAKHLMNDEEVAEDRHPIRSDDDTREAAIGVFKAADQDSGFTRRTLIRRSLIGAAVAAPLPGIVLLRDLGPAPERALFHTAWKEGVRLTTDPLGVPIKAADVTLGSAFHVIPEGIKEKDDYLEEKAKAAVLLTRMEPDDIHESAERKDWSYNGIVAYSKICTHVGCPVALIEQHTHNLLCPCHQSTFDIANEARVVFGPAARPLPQLPIAVDNDGYLIAKGDFSGPVGPSFWEIDHR